MSRLGIYESAWIDLVFEGKNQAYGAYQLRRESVKSALSALFAGLLFVFGIGITVKFLSDQQTNTASTIIETDWTEPLTVNRVYIQEEKKTIKTSQTQESSATTQIKDQLKNPTIVEANLATENIAANNEIKNSGNTITEGTGNPGTTTSTTEHNTTIETPTEIDYGNTVLNVAILDKMPEFPGGINKFYNYVGNNFEKPEIEGLNTLKVFVTFVIEKDGSMTDIKVLKDPGYGMGSEAIRVLKSIKTKWLPGMVNSKPVRTAYNLPITLQIN